MTRGIRADRAYSTVNCDDQPDDRAAKAPADVRPAAASAPVSNRSGSAARGAAGAPTRTRTPTRPGPTALPRPTRHCPKERRDRGPSWRPASDRPREPVRPGPAATAAGSLGSPGSWRAARRRRTSSLRITSVRHRDECHEQPYEQQRTQHRQPGRQAPDPRGLRGAGGGVVRTLDGGHVNSLRQHVGGPAVSYRTSEHLPEPDWCGLTGRAYRRLAGQGSHQHPEPLDLARVLYNEVSSCSRG